MNCEYEMLSSACLNETCITMLCLNGEETLAKKDGMFIIELRNLNIY